MSKNEDSKYLFVLIIISVIILFSHLNFLPVNIMEARNFITAREMLTDDNWIFTTINGLPRYEKPPLPTWLTAISIFLFQTDNLYVMRLPVTLITILLVLFIYLFSKKLKLSSLHSFCNGLILITSFYIFFSGRDNNWDIYCHSFMIISLYFLWKILHKEASFILAILGGLFFAFSILSKGPISLYTLFFPFLIAYFFIYKINFRKISNFKYIFIYLFIGVVLGLSWYVFIRIEDPDYFLKMAKKESGNWIGYEQKPFYYYWNFFTQSGIWTIPSLIALFYPYLKNRVTNLKAYQFTLIWTLTSVFLLSIIPEKKTRYLLPVLIPLALNTGFYIQYLWNNFKKLNKVEKIVNYLTFGMLALTALCFPLIFLFTLIFLNINFENDIWFYFTSIILVFIGIVLFYYLYKKDFKKIFYTVILLQVSIIAFGIPLAKYFLYNPNYNSPKNARNIVLNEKIKLYEYSSFTPEIIWNYEEKIPIFNDSILKNNNEPKIGLFVSPLDTINAKNKLINYSFIKKDIVDLNQTSKNSSEYKNRLVRYFYILEAK